MKLYYKAVNKDGKPIEGIIEANSVSEAATYLRTKEYIPIKIQKKQQSAILSLVPFLPNKIREKDIVLFTRQLSLMITAGLTLIRSLDILKEEITNEAMNELLDDVIRDIQEGASFSQAISKYPNVFSPVYISLVKASEISGLLDKALLHLADNLEKQQKLKNTIKGALLYPAIVIVMMGVVVLIMMVFVIPQLNVLYEELDVDLPFATRIVVGLSGLIVNFWYIILIGLVSLVFGFIRWRKTETGQIITDNFLLRIPIFSPVIRKSILTEISRTLGLLVGSGTLVVESLAQTAGVAGNVHFEHAILEVSKKVEKGVTVGNAMAGYPLFPPILVELVRVGEQTGKLHETLLKASEYFEAEVELAVKALTTAMEPLIMVLLGVGVGFLIFSIITPIYQLTTAIK